MIQALLAAIIVCCLLAKKLGAKHTIARIRDPEIFLGCCTVLNGTLAWDIAGGRDESACIDLDPLMLYALKKSKERIA